MPLILIYSLQMIFISVRCISFGIKCRLCLDQVLTSLGSDENYLGQVVYISIVSDAFHFDQVNIMRSGTRLWHHVNLVNFKPGPHARTHFLWQVFQWPFLSARVHEIICPDFKWQIHLLKSWRDSFHVVKTPQKCRMRKFVRVHYQSQKICHVHPYSEVGSGFFGFVSTVHGHFWRIDQRVFNIAFAVFMHEQKFGSN